MALLQNGSILSQYPLRYVGAGVAADISVANRNDRRNIYSGVTDQKSGIPNGHGTPSAWLVPRKPGGMSSINYALISIGGTATGAMGVTSPASATLTFNVSGVGGLITSGFGIASFSVTTNIPTITATLSGDGSAGVSFASTGVAKGIGYFIGSTTVSLSAGMTPYATGSMSGSTTDSNILTNDSIAAAVWSNGNRSITGAVASVLTPQEQQQLIDLLNKVNQVQTVIDATYVSED